MKPTNRQRTYYYTVKWADPADPNTRSREECDRRALPAVRALVELDEARRAAETDPKAAEEAS